MGTFMTNKETLERKWYVLDAAGKPLGHTAAKAAVLLRGKEKPDFTPHVDCGDFVIVINAKDAVLTGKKLDQKMYRRHSGYPGRLERGQIPPSDVAEARACDEARRQGNASEEFHRQMVPRQTQGIFRART